MTRFYRQIFIAAVALVPMLQSGSALAAPAAEDAAELERAKAAYDEGRKAYRIGDMKTAVARFEEAYGLTENPIILYNIGLGYRRLYDQTGELAHLRRAKVVLENFLLELTRDSGLGSPDEVKAILEEIEKDIARKSEAEQQAEQQANQGPESSAADAAEEADEDPNAEPAQLGPSAAELSKAKQHKKLGIGLMAGGGGIVLGGAVAGVLFGLRYSGELDSFDDSVAAAQEDGCPGSASICDDYAEQQAALIDRADSARKLAIISGVALGALGAGVGAVGALLFIKGRKVSGAEMASLRVQPTWGGVSLSGRF